MTGLDPSGGKAEQPAGKLWGGRFEGRLDAAFERFNRSLPFDHRLLAADLEGSAAWARGLGRAGVLRPSEVKKLEKALRRIARETAADPTLLADSSAEDVHSFVEGRLQQHVGELARKLHTGRSRNDQVATDLKLFVRQQIADLDAALCACAAALVELADRYADLPLPGYTHLQRAQLVTAGHHALAYVEMLARDRSRLHDARRRLDTCPLGSAALAGSAFAVDRKRLATELGFAAGPTRNSLDAVSDRDHVCEIAFCCSMIVLHLSRLAEDWIFFAGWEAGFLELDDAVSTGSSLMPQKKNPDGLELIRGKTGRVLGHLQGLLVMLKALPLAYDKDLQEDKEALFDSLDTTVACLHIAALCARGVRYREQRCRDTAAFGHMAATDVADLLVQRGVPFRDAHERVGRVVRRALDEGVEIHALPREVLAELLPELPGVQRQLAPRAQLQRRNTIGGTAPARVRAEVRVWNRRLATWQR